jgi:voltage-gated potassium channel Kch
MTCEHAVCNDTELCEGRMVCAPQPLKVFGTIDAMVVIFFTVDYILRLLLIAFMPPRLNTLIDSDWDELEERHARKANRRVNKDPKMTSLEAVIGMIFSVEGIIDIASIIPFYILLSSGNRGASTSFVRVCRIFRIFKVIKAYGPIITVFKRTFTSSMDAMVVMAMIVLVAQILFACIIYAFEAGTYTVNSTYPHGAWLRKIAGTSDYSESILDSIPTAMYWAIFTLTTVGYGEIAPVTTAGRIVASIAAICGVFCIALPVTVIGANFSSELSAYQDRQWKNRRARRKLKVHMIRHKLLSLVSLQVMFAGSAVNHDDFAYDDDGEVQLTDQQERDMHEAFKFFDVDGSRKLFVRTI